MPTLVGISVLALVGAAGCQSNPEPPPISGGESSSSPSPSPSPTAAAPPSLPAEAQGTSEASAKAFVRHYVDLLNFAFATGNTAAVAAMSDPGCASCSSVIDRVDQVYQAGGAIESDGWTVTSVASVPGAPANRPILDLGIRMSPQRVTERAGARARSFEGGKLPATFHLRRRNGEWRVEAWERAA